jgi:hypothetical protein
MTSTIQASPPADVCAERKSYRQPRLIGYGSLAVLTKGGGSLTQEAAPALPACGSTPFVNRATPCIATSDIRCKHNVLRMGTHSSGVGLYMYDYLPEFAGRMGVGKFFGVMAQEVLLHNPAAVLREASGYYAVNYSALESSTAH